VPDGPSITAAHAWRASLPAPRTPRPNVLLLVLDSVSAHALGRSVNGVPITPNLDQLARESLRMRRAWTTATHSNYAQMALLSSLLPIRTTGFDQYERLDYPRVLFHDLLHELGYDTATMSSQDESWQGMLRFQSTGTPTTYRHAPDHPGPHIDTGAERVVPDDATTGYALDWLRQRRQQPWALYLNLQAPHFPYPLPDGVEPTFEQAPIPPGFDYFGYPIAALPAAERRHANALAFVDQQVGRIRRALEQTRELDRTVWIVTADHGELFGEHGLVTHGRSLYDAEARIPLWIRMPGRLEPRDDDHPVSHIDVLPTLAELLGVPAHPSFQGQSFVADDDASHGHPVLLTIQGLRAADALVCWPWKLVVDRSGGQTRLYDLADDPNEERDRLADAPRLAYHLGLLLDAQRRAQLTYHKPAAAHPHERFAPRLAHCPALPGAQ
jgi:arylsulfatase A-like enzyme